MSKDDDLGQLIEEASGEIESDFQQSQAAKPKRRQKGRYKPLLPLVILAIAYMVYAAQQQEVPDSEVIASELTDLLRQARESVESAFVDGQPPIIIPSAALGAVVNYEVFRGGYFLSVTANEVLAEMDNTGKLTISGVN